MLLRVLGTVLAAATATGDGVERAADGTPVAFRIWRAGVNVTDHGVHAFTEKSAKALLAEQQARGNRYSIDVDHLSLSKEAPPESRKAVGWHRLEVRDGELWAVDVEWTDTVRSGLTKDPPEWRYFSPAYDVEKKTGEILSYLNTALTNNPATWSVTELATRASAGDRAMNEEQMKAYLAALFGDDGDKKAEAKAALEKCAEGGDDDKMAKRAKAALAAAFGEPGGDGDEKKKEEEKRAAAAAAAEDEKKKEEAKRAAAARTASDAEVLRTVGEQDKRIAELEEVEQDRKRDKILAGRPDLTEKQRKLLAKKSPEEILELLEAMPAPTVDPAAAARVTATRGSHDGTGEVRAARLPPGEHEDLIERMGGQVEIPSVHWGDGLKHSKNAKVYETIDRAEALKILARRKASPALGRAPITSSIESARRVEAARNGGVQ